MQFYIDELSPLLDILRSNDIAMYNEQQTLQYTQAIYISQAVWGKMPKSPYFIEGEKELSQEDKVEAMKAWARALKGV